MAQYAFWHYDQFPYYDGGEITEMRDDGGVQTREHGGGTLVSSVLHLSARSGENN